MNNNISTFKDTNNIFFLNKKRVNGKIHLSQIQQNNNSFQNDIYINNLYDNLKSELLEKTNIIINNFKVEI